MAQLKISVVEKSEHDHSHIVLALQGEVDPKTVGKLKRRLDKISELKFKTLILDMAETSYVNSSALAVLVKFAHAFKADGGSIAVTNVNARVKLPFEMLGLLVFFQFFESIDEAKSALLGS